MFRDSKATVFCWAMGITQHRNAVATIKEFVNVALLQGNIGKPGAGLCPVRGHSNVQGDRTMGIWERPKPAFLDALQQEFGFDPPREHGLRHGRGGPGAARRPGAGVLRDGRQLRLRRLRHRGHRGRDAAGRPDRARLDQAQPLARRHRPRGADPARRSAAASATAPAAASSGSPSRTRCRRCTRRRARSSRPRSTCGPRSTSSARSPRRRSARRPRAPVGRLPRRLQPPSGARSPTWCPGCAAYDEKVDQPGGFVLPHPPRDSRDFPTDAGRAVFSVSPIDVLEVPEGRLLLQTLRSHDQFNTTIYGLDDRYRGIKGGRRVVFVHPDDIDPPRVRRRRPGRPGQRVARRLRARGRRVPDRVLRPAPRLRGGVLPRDQPADPARLQGRGQQHPDLEVGRGPARERRAAGTPA